MTTTTTMSSQNSTLQSRQQIELTYVPETDEVVTSIQKQLALMAHIKAPVFVSDERRSRAPVIISAVLDRSGSMAGSKMTLLKKTMEFVIQSMKPEDQLGIITFNNQVKIDLALTKMTEEGKLKATIAIKAITAERNTNLSGGLFAGIKQISEAIAEAQKQTPESQQADQSTTATIIPPVETQYTNSPAPAVASSTLESSSTSSSSTSSTSSSSESALTSSSSPSSSTPIVASVWVFTDGLANEGIQDSAILKAETEALVAKVSSSCSLFTFGFGNDHSSVILTDISKAGNGLYYYVETEDKIPDAFTDCLGGLLTVTAQNLHLTLTPCEANQYSWAPWTNSFDQKRSKYHCKILQVQTAFKHEIDPISGVATVHIPDIYSEEVRDIVFQVEVPILLTSRDPETILTMNLQYFNVLTCRQEEVSRLVRLSRPSISTEWSSKPIPVEMTRQQNRLLCMEALTAAHQLSEQRNMAQAREVLVKAICSIRASTSGSDPFCQALIADLQDCIGKLQDYNTYTVCGSHTMNSMNCTHSYQRSAGTRNDSYTTSYKSTMNMTYRARQ
jgi:hypothetical protein